MTERLGPLRQRADVAPGEGRDGVAVQEVIPGFGQFPTELQLGASRRQFLQELQRRDMAGLVDQRRQVIGIEPVDIVVLGDLA